MARHPLKGHQSGIAGEYFVAAELSRMGYVASLTLKNTAGIDVLASNISATRTVAIQVKTSQGKSPVWTLGEKEEKVKSAKMIYVFVNLGGRGSLPKFYVVTSDTVARQIKRTHRAFLKTPGRGGQEHKDTSFRIFRATEADRDKWDRLGLDQR